ncbi:MAG: dihydrofolate reductase [Flavobacteriales bacterium]
MKIIFLAALDRNRVMGKDNALIWHLPADLQRFKHITMGHPVVMGRKTFNSIGNRALPKRDNYVLSRSETFDMPQVHTYRCIDKLLTDLKGEEKIYIIGGAQIFEVLMPLADVLDLTRIDKAFEGDAYFPKIDEKIWELASEEFHAKDEQNPYDFAFLRYIRKNKIPR